MAMCLALASSGSGAVPPPWPQTGADCEHPTYASDRLVCSDATLLALDRAVLDAWLALSDVQAGFKLPPLLESQQAWFGRRSRCAFVEDQAACLRAAYLDRAGVLRAWQQAASGTLATPGHRMRCANAPWGEAIVTVHVPDASAMVITSLSKGILAIASPSAGKNGWLPFARLDGAAAQIRLRPLSDAAITCAPN
jgi:uncharacterized protein